MNKTTARILKMVNAGLCLALCYVLPFLTMNNQQLNTALSPMHIPVFLCAYLSGPWWAMGVGLIAPVLRSVTIGMPPPLPALAMSFELAAYGLSAGLLYRLLPRKPQYIFISLISAMVIGRVVSVLAKMVIFSIAQNKIAVNIYIADAFVKTLPGAALHIALIPGIVMALQNALPWLKTRK